MCLYLDLHVHIRVRTSPVARNHNCLHPRPEITKCTWLSFETQNFEHNLTDGLREEYIAIKITFLISAMISFGSLDDVVFMLQVKRNDRGLISPLSFTTLLQIKDR